MEFTARDYLSVPEAAKEMGTKPETLREWAARAEDPFPIRILPWCTRNGRVSRAEMDAWYLRNATQYSG